MAAPVPQTLTQLRRNCAAQIAPLFVGTATSGSNQTQLEMTAWPIKSSKAVSDLLNDYYIFRPSATTASDKCRLVDDSGYTPSTGVLLPDQAWTVAPYANGVGETIELHGILPPISDGVNDLHAVINACLQRWLVRAELTFNVASVTARRHSLASVASWMVYPWQVRAVGYLQVGESRTDNDPFSPSRRKRGTTRPDSGTLYLEGWTHGNTADTIYIEAMADAYNYCATSSGSFGGQAGLTLETDRALVDANWLAYAVLVECWNRFPWLMDASAGQRPVNDRKEAAAILSQYTALNQRIPEQQYDTTETGMKALTWGPVPSVRGPAAW